MTMASPRPITVNRDRLFYTGMTAALLITAFAGFAPSYYLKTYFNSAPLSPVTHAHAAAYSAWMILLFVQTALIASYRTDIHRKLGVFGAALALVMVPLGVSTAVWAIRNGHTPPGIDPRSFLVLPLFDVALFAGFVTAGIAMRKNLQAHKRLMLLSTIAMIDAAIARLPGLFAFGPPAFFALQDLFLVAAALYDYKTRGRVHPAYIWGGLIILISQPLRLVVSQTPLWLAFGDWIKG